MKNAHYTTFGKFGQSLREHCDQDGYLLDTYDAALEYLLDDIDEDDQEGIEWAEDEANTVAQAAADARDEAARKVEAWRRKDDIYNAESLDELCDALNDTPLDTSNDPDQFGVDFDLLPTFGGDEPEPNTPAFSWDEDRVLVDGGHRFTVVPRTGK